MTWQSSQQQRPRWTRWPASTLPASFTSYCWSWQFLPTHSLTQITAPLPAVVFPHLQPGSKEEPPPPASPWSLASKRIRPAGKVGQAPALNVAGCSPLEQLLAGTQAPGPQTEEPLCAPLPYMGAQASFLFIPCCQDPTVRNSAPPASPSPHGGCDTNVHSPQGLPRHCAMRRGRQGQPTKG